MGNLWANDEEYDKINLLAAHLWREYSKRVGTPENLIVPYDGLDNQTLAIFRGHAKAALDFFE